MKIFNWITGVTITLCAVAGLEVYPTRHILGGALLAVFFGWTAGNIVYFQNNSK